MPKLRYTKPTLTKLTSWQYSGTTRHGTELYVSVVERGYGWLSIYWEEKDKHEHTYSDMYDMGGEDALQFLTVLAFDFDMF